MYHVVVTRKTNSGNTLVSVKSPISIITGKDGAVTVNSREELPYIDAVLHEVMRIQPVTPMGVPRRLRNDTKLGKVPFVT